MKKILSIVLAVIMIFSVTAFASARSYNPYRDYDYDYYYDNNYDYNWDYYRNHDRYEDYFADIYGSDNRDAIEYLYDMGILQGYGNGYYGPHNTLTRAEACAIVTRMMVESYQIRKSNTNTFTDVANNAWYREYVDTALREGYMNGYGDGTFGPEDDVTYAQFATIILNMLGYDVVNLDGTWPENVETIAEKIGLYRHVGNVVSDDAIYREDVAQMLYNALRCRMVRWNNGKLISTGRTLGDMFNKTTDNNTFNTVIGTVENVERYYYNGYYVVTFEEYDEEFYVNSDEFDRHSFREGSSVTFTYYFDRYTGRYYVSDIMTRNATTRFYKDMEVARILPAGGNLCRVTFADDSMFTINGSRDNLGFSVLDTISFYADKSIYDEYGVITKVVEVIPYEEEEVTEEPDTDTDVDSDEDVKHELDPGFGVEPEVFYTAEGWTRFHIADCQYVTGAEDGVVITFDPAVHTEQTPCKICLADLYD